jgi:hypothetical protein
MVMLPGMQGYVMRVDRHGRVEDQVVGWLWWWSLGLMMLYGGGVVSAVGRAHLLVLGRRSWAT